MNVFVALSGGVDSAVAAHMLMQQGHDVTGVFIRVWQPDFLPCSQDEEERAALRVAAFLGIPFKRLDLSEEYKREVVDTMIAEYTAGRTPNPDVLCNRFIKFGGFWEYAREHGADAIATGHHARISECPRSLLGQREELCLMRGVDEGKDQSYFLWQLTQDDLAHTLMPIGGMCKDDVRAYAKQHNLPSATKADSQGLCFIGDVDMKTFLRHFVDAAPGHVLNEAGATIGTHEGAVFVTLGQRGGFTLATTQHDQQPHYVVAKDIAANTITVSHKPHVSDTLRTNIALAETNWLHTPTPEHTYTCQLRYHGEKLPCHIADNTVVFENSNTIAAGQSVVVYDDDVVIGGGVAAAE